MMNGEEILAYAFEAFPNKGKKVKGGMGDETAGTSIMKKFMEIMAKQKKKI